MVTRLDRLARSTRDLLNTLASITGKGAGFRYPEWLAHRRHPDSVTLLARGAAGRSAEVETYHHQLRGDLIKRSALVPRAGCLRRESGLLRILRGHSDRVTHVVALSGERALRRFLMHVLPSGSTAFAIARRFHLFDQPIARASARTGPMRATATGMPTCSAATCSATSGPRALSGIGSHPEKKGPGLRPGPKR